MGAQLSGAKSNTNHFVESVRYAGTMRRIFAAFLDFLFISAIAGIIALPIGACIFYGVFGANFTATIIGGILAVIAYLFASILPVVYYAIFESSGWQATPAKRLLGLQVCTVDGQRFTFWGAVARYLLQGIFYVVLLLIVTVVLKVVLFCLNIDLVTSSVLVQSIFVALAWLPILLFLFVPTCTTRKQAASDKLLKRLVIRPYL